MTGSWIQAEGDNPILLTLRDDGSAYYYATVSNAADYTCPYSVEGSKAQITLTLNSEASADPELLYGMEKLMA